jgi:DNA-3-methyladenine glycosylase II
VPSTAPLTDPFSLRPPYWDEAIRHLTKKDKKLGKIIALYEGETLQSRGHAFHTLARSIVGQQISVKAADSVWKRFESACVKPSSVNVEGLHPLHVLTMTDEDLRACGLSGSKVTYMKALAGHFHTQDIHAEGYWHAKSDAEIIKELTAIKGIGVWTAEMFLIFHLMRPDVFPLGDIGLLNAVERHYGISAKDKKAIAAYGERWRPYRSVATWYLWRSLDPVPVEY